jgi:hypothetical protein
MKYSPIIEAASKVIRLYGCFRLYEIFSPRPKSYIEVVASNRAGSNNQCLSAERNFMSLLFLKRTAGLFVVILMKERIQPLLALLSLPSRRLPLAFVIPSRAPTVLFAVIPSKEGIQFFT